MRGKLITTVCLFSWLLISSNSSAIDNNASGEYLNVLAISGINLRDAPKGTVIQKIPYGARIKTLQVKSTNNPETIEGIQGNWVKVEYNGAMGFLFPDFRTFYCSSLKPLISLNAL